MVKLIHEDNAIKREIAIDRRREAGKPTMEIVDEILICNNCNISICQELRILENDPSCVRLNILSQTSSNTCLICNAHYGVRRLSLKCRIDIFVKMNIYVPENCLCCNHHLNENGLMLDCLLVGLRYVNRPYILKGKQLDLFLQGLRNEVGYSAQRRYKDETSLTEDQFKSISPITKEQYNDLFTYCEPVAVEGGHRYVSKKDLLCFLCKMRQGLSDEFLCVMFHYSSKQATSLAISTVRQSLTIRFTRENIGFQALTRQQYIEQHITEFSNQLYNSEPQKPKVIVYNDCTYLNIEKSSCFKVLRQSYCVHKGRHLLKPAIFVAPDGYILDIQGPYFSNAANNDARILDSQLSRDVNIMRNWFQDQDIFILDRGYRDAIPILQRIGICYKMPLLLDRGQSQFLTEEANESRIVTKTRWIVEARNGHLKQIYKMFANPISTHHIKN